MTLPILVPTVHERPLLGVAVRVHLHRRYLHWRTHLLLGHHALRPAVPTRSLRFMAPTSAQVRAQRIAHWGARSTPAIPPPVPAAPWLPNTASGYRELFRDGEKLLKQLLRRRQQSQRVSPQTVSTIAATFDSSSWRVKVAAVQQPVLVFMLISMYWRGCRHPAALHCPTLHPPTALSRWLSRFTVQQQVEHGRQILDLLTAEELRVHDFARSVVEHLLYRRAGTTCTVTLLPEMLRAVEPE